MTALQALIEPVTAGDPMSEQKWVRASLRHLCRRLGEAGHRASPPTVRRLLKTHGYRLHANTKQLEAGAAHPDRGAAEGLILPASGEVPSVAKRRGVLRRCMDAPLSLALRARQLPA